MTSSEIKIVAGIGVACVGIIAYAYVKKQDLKTKEAENLVKAKQIEFDKMEQETKLPPEYWTAKKAESEASVEKYRIDKESSERLTIDSRDRKAAEDQAKREFEKDAPPEYWAHKKVEEEEKTRRHQMDLDDARLNRQAQTERAIAAKNAEALASGAKSLERAITNASRANTYYNL